MTTVFVTMHQDHCTMLPGGPVGCKTMMWLARKARRPMAILWLAILLFLSPDAGSDTIAGKGRTGTNTSFKEWRVGCDNTARCKAYSVWGSEDDDKIDKPDKYYAHLTLDREGAGEARSIFGLHQESGRAAAIEWDHGKQHIGLKARDDQQIAEADNPLIIRALRSESYLSMVDSGHRELGRISLAGASAALLWMDDQQHRINTVTALIKPGPLPASSIPSPPPVPIIYAPALSRKAPATFGLNTKTRLIGRESLCTDEGKYGNQTDFHRIDDSHTLAIIILDCHPNFNWQGSVYVITDGSHSLPQEAKTDASDDIQWMWYDDGHYLAEGIDNHGVENENYQDEFVWDGRRFAHSESHVVFKDDIIITYRSKVIRSGG